MYCQALPNRAKVLLLKGLGLELPHKQPPTMLILYLTNSFVEEVFCAAGHGSIDSSHVWILGPGFV